MSKSENFFSDTNFPLDSTWQSYNFCLFLQNYDQVDFMER